MNDGGQAFPRLIEEIPLHERHSREVFKLSGGMSIRDWFAGMALIGIIQTNGQAFPTGSAHIAYEHADAMLKARERQ